MKNLYSLWILPPSKVRKLLQEIITDLSNKYHGPDFEPHITLLGDIPMEIEKVEQKTKLLVSKLKPFPLSLSEVSFSTTYFQSVLVRVKASAALMNANMLAKEIYKRDNNVFMPHISLVYGLHTMTQREKIASEIHIPKNISFSASKLAIVPSTQNPEEWEHIKEFEIK